MSEDDTSSGLKVGFGNLSVTATGTIVITLLLVLTIMAMHLYIVDLIRQVQWISEREHREIVRGMDDLFLATIMPDQVKRELSPPLKDKVERKIERRIEEKTADTPNHK
jgi:hypothetical protein